MCQKFIKSMNPGGFGSRGEQMKHQGSKWKWWIHCSSTTGQEVEVLVCPLYPGSAGSLVDAAFIPAAWKSAAGKGPDVQAEPEYIAKCY